MVHSNESTLVASPSTDKRKADKMDSPEEQALVKVIEVVPNADTTFIIGSGKDALHMKVSEMVVGLASPVFSTMLSSKRLR